MNSGDDEPWAQLVCVTDVDTPPVPIFKDKLIIGRSNDSDVSHVGNKLVSGKHCYIERDDEGKVWLYDTSTNGTLLNLKVKLTKGECREISHGDEFHVVHKKDNTDEDIGYMFQDMKALEEETSSDLDDTQDYEYEQTVHDPNATLADEEVNAVSTPSPSNKRKIPNEENKEQGPSIKKPKQDTPFASTCGSKDEEKASASVAKLGSDRPTPAAKDSSAASTSKAGGDDPQPTSSGKDPGNLTSAKTKEPEEDALAEALVCIICQELLHDCISLQPCMHSFCSGCYSEWMERSIECPSCRMKVERINKNHIVNNLVEAYLKHNPDKKRPESDIQSLDAKNKITRDMLYPTNQPVGSLPGSQTSYRDSDESDGDEEEEEYEEEEHRVNDHYGNAPGRVFNPLAVNAFGIPFQALFRQRAAAPARCRQCVNYDPAFDPNAFVLPAPAQDGQDDPDAKRFPTAPPFQCRFGGDHVLCLCCLQPMPDRRREFNYRHDCSVPPQQCALCYRSFCHAYWGCRKAGCNGCLAKLKDMNFGKACLNFLILDNAHESDVFRNYLEAKGLSVRDVLGECLAKMVRREYVCTDQGRIDSLNGINTPVCYACGLRSFKELAYAYRKDIPNDQLPNQVTSRPDCHWGKSCRTQRTKPEHARRYNHICEQTRIV